MTTEPKAKLTEAEKAIIEKPNPNVFRFEPEFETQKKVIINGVEFTQWCRTGMIYEWRTPKLPDGTYFVVADQAFPTKSYYVAKGPSGDKTDSGINGLRKALETAVIRYKPLDEKDAFTVSLDGGVVEGKKDV